MRIFLAAAVAALTLAAMPATATDDDVDPVPVLCLPTLVTAEPVGMVVFVNWTTVPGASAYHVYRATGAGNFSLVANFEHETDLLVDTQVESNITYRYYVVAVVGGEETDPCGIHEVTTNPGCPIQASAHVFNGAVIVTWTALPVSDNYTVYRAEGNGSLELVATTDASTQSYQDLDVEAGVTYTYQVHAVVDGQERPSCGDVSATVPEPTQVPFFPTGGAVALAAIGVLGAVAVLTRRKA